MKDSAWRGGKRLDSSSIFDYMHGKGPRVDLFGLWIEFAINNGVKGGEFKTFVFPWRIHLLRRESLFLF